MSNYAWGPERTTYLEGAQADSVVLNSITDAGIGDERNFVRVREAETLTPRMDAVEIEPGKNYEVYIYFRNDAKREEAAGVRVQSFFSQVIDSEHWGMVGAEVSTDGADTVWDTARFVYNGKGKIELRYVNDTAVVKTGGAANGKVLPAGLFRKGGALVGYSALNGVLPAGAEYAGYIVYEVRAVESVREDFNSTYGEKFEMAGVLAQGAPSSGGSGGASAGGVASEAGLPQTGMGAESVIMTVALGVAVVIGWGLLRKIRKRGTIEW